MNQQTMSVLEAHAPKIFRLLKIESPTVQTVELLYRASDGSTCAQPRLDAKSLPLNFDPIGGYFADDKDIVYLSELIGGYNPEIGKYVFKKYTDAEELYLFVHELRHVWQKTYHYDKYYATKSFDDNDDSEIDADAFALAFFFSENTTYSHTDLPVISHVILGKSLEDGGKRWDKAVQLSKEYRFNSSIKLSEAKNGILRN